MYLKQKFFWFFLMSLKFILNWTHDLFHFCKYVSLLGTWKAKIIWLKFLILINFFSLQLSPLFQHVALDKANCQFPLWFKETTHSGLLLANLPVSSSLSLIFAVLALASPTELVQPTQTVPDNSIFLYAILDQLFSTIAR